MTRSLHRVEPTIDKTDRTPPDYPLAPAGSVAARRDPEIYPRPELEPDDPAADGPPPFQFSLGGLMALFVAAALYMGLLSLFNSSRDIQAGVMGIGVLVGIVVLALIKPTQPIIHLAWWAMLILYLAACLLAIISRQAQCAEPAVVATLVGLAVPAVIAAPP